MKITNQIKNKDFYKSYIGKEVSISNKKYKVTAVRELDSGMIIIEYEINGSQKGVINAELVKL